MPLLRTSEGKVLADLAVWMSGAERVRTRYEIETSQLLSDTDPVVLSQTPNALTLKSYKACDYLRKAYSIWSAERGKKEDYNEQMKAWFERRLALIDDKLRTLQNAVQVWPFSSFYVEC